MRYYVNIKLEKQTEASKQPTNSSELFKLDHFKKRKTKKKKAKITKKSNKDECTHTRCFGVYESNECH